ncbi:ABC transporter permease [Limosilactobacillus allomucosae]|uniref:ABC transporter permease n=1 Tax=Limosilactobacillus allomucosae TaxID=3142938 RepID=UPI003262F43C
MNSLFKKRRQAHLLRLMKYWRLVFNDQFTIALFFMIGALAYTYAQWLKTLSPGAWWIRWLLILWFVLVMQVGRFATLLKPADPVFLLPQSDGIKKYLNQAFSYSLVLGELISLGLLIIGLPLAMVDIKLTAPAILELLLAGFVAKLSWMELAKAQLSLQWSRHAKQLRLGQWIAPLLIGMLGWLIAPVWGCVGAVLSYLVIKIGLQKQDLDWRAAVDAEQKRMYDVYRFFNLFTDVPSVKGGIKRRTWAKGLIRWLTIPDHAWSYLYARGFLRDTETSGLVGRLTIVGMLIVFFVPLGWLRCLLALLFIYLIAMQLMPFAQHYQNNVFTHLYPIEQATQLTDFQALLKKVMISLSLLLILASLGTELDWMSLLSCLILGGLELYWLINFYFKKKMQK